MFDTLDDDDLLICSLPRPHQESGEKFLAAAKAASTTELFVELAEGATAATGKTGKVRNHFCYLSLTSWTIGVY